MSIVRKINEKFSLINVTGSHSIYLDFDLLGNVSNFRCKEVKYDLSDIIELVNKLKRHRLITIRHDIKVVGIQIWDIDDTQELYIETYHHYDYDDMSFDLHSEGINSVTKLSEFNDLD